jgi:hypothetical protein
MKKFAVAASLVAVVSARAAAPANITAQQE